MIDVGVVLDAVTALLRDPAGDGDPEGVALPVGRSMAPQPTPQDYAVAEAPPGTERWGGLSCPEASATVRVRIRAVSTASSAEVAAQSVEKIAHDLTTVLLDRRRPLTGTGWAVTGRRQIADSGTLHEGPTANRSIDVDLTVARAAASDLTP